MSAMDLRGVSMYEPRQYDLPVPAAELGALAQEFLRLIVDSARAREALTHSVEGYRAARSARDEARAKPADLQHLTDCAGAQASAVAHNAAALAALEEELLALAPKVNDHSEALGTELRKAAPPTTDQLRKAMAAAWDSAGMLREAFGIPEERWAARRAGALHALDGVKPPVKMPPAPFGEEWRKACEQGVRHHRQMAEKFARTAEQLKGPSQGESSRAAGTPRAVGSVPPQTNGARG